LQKIRTHYQDQLVLTSHNFEVQQQHQQKPGVTKTSRKRPSSSTSSEKANAGNTERGLSNLVLIVNNWGFVREVQHKADVRLCTPSDFQVQLKLSSTAFRSSANPDCEFPFDKQAANFPFDSFVQLHESPSIKKFIGEVRAQYEALEGPFPDEAEEEDEEEIGHRRLKIDPRDPDADEEQEEEEEEEIFKKPQRVRGKKCLSGQTF
jgi:hypothetical protein